MEKKKVLIEVYWEQQGDGYYVNRNILIMQVNYHIVNGYELLPIIADDGGIKYEIEYANDETKKFCDAFFLGYIASIRTLEQLYTRPYPWDESNEN